MLALGILSLFQVVFLPGLITLRLIKFRGSFWQRLLYIFALSLLVNYCLVFMFASINLYTREVVLGLFIVQAVIAAWLYRDTFRQPLIDYFGDLWDRSVSSLTGLFPRPAASLPLPQKALYLLSLLFTVIVFIYALERILWFVQLFIDNIGTVFDGWDAVYSWNRWAIAWFSGQIPLDSRFYPQLIPANWSLTYVFMGESAIQIFAKSVMPLFAVGIAIQFFDLGLATRRAGYFVAVIVLRALVVRFLGTGLYNGYIDIAVSFFALLPFYTLLKAEETTEDGEKRMLLVLGLFFAAAAAVTKQPGVYILMVYPVIAYAVVFRPHFGSRLVRINWHSVLIICIIALLIPITWYVFKFVLIMLGVDYSEVAANASYAALASGNAGIIPQIMRSLQKFGIFLAFFPLVFLLIPLLPKLARWLTVLIILPFPVVWALMASYDTRNLAIFLPIFALVIGIASELVFRIALRFLLRIQFEKWPTAILPVVVVVVILAAAFSLPDSWLRARDMAARQQVFSPSMNRELNTLIDENPDVLILTNYPVAYVLGKADSQVDCWYNDFEKFTESMKEEKITHLLVPTIGVHPQISDQIAKWESEGFLRFLFRDQGTTVINYSLYEITR